MANFPTKQLDFNNWQTNFMALVLANLIPWAVNSAQWTTLLALQSPYLSTYAVGNKGIKTNRTPTQTKACKDATTAFKGAPFKGLRTFIANNIAKNPLIPNSMRLSLQTTIFKTTKTKINAPSTTPVLVGYDVSTHNLAIMDMRDATTPDSKKKVKGVIGFELWGILVPFGGAAPKVGAMLFMQCYTVNDGGEIIFPDGSSGSTFYGRARWYNPRHMTGSFGDTFSFMVG